MIKIFGCIVLVLFGINTILGVTGHGLLPAVAFAGSIVNEFLPELVIQIMNIAVGVILIIFGIKLVLSNKEKNARKA